MTLELTAGANDAGRRLDRILRKCLPDHSLSLIHRLLRQGKVLVDGKPASPDKRIQPKSVILIVIRKNDGVRHEREKETGSLPEILWQGTGIIVFNKPSGLASHGENSLDTLVKAWLAEKLPPSLSFKPGPLHRLDKFTSGAIVFSENLEGAQMFSRLLREQKVKKTYLAIVEGHILGSRKWQDKLVRDKTVKKTFVGDTESGISGRVLKNAFTTVRGIASNGAYSLIEAHIATGRTHQIRAQAAAHGHPLAGDAKYGGKTFPGGFFLHAWKLELDGDIKGFPQPLIAPLPQAFSAQIKTLFQKCTPK